MKKIYSALLIFAVIMTPLAGIQAQTRGVGVRIKDEQTNKTEEVTLYKASYALIIGVSDYTKGWKDLPGVLDDVKAVETALQKQGFEVTTIINPTRTTLRSGIELFINDHGYDADNRLLIYYAGHGDTGKTADGRKLGYIVPADAPLRTEDDKGFQQTAVSMDQVELYARTIQAKHALFVFDSCFSGSLLNARRSATPPIITDKVAKPVRQFITAGTDEQEVPDKSVFREQFVAGLNGEGDLNKDGFITVTELADFLQTKVTNYTKGSQTPQYGKIFDSTLDKGDLIFISPLGNKTPPTEVDDGGGKTQPAVSGEAAFWQTIENSTDERDFENYLSQAAKGEFPGTYRAAAEVKLKRLREKSALARWEKFKATARGLLKYDYIANFGEEGLAWASIGDKRGFIDKNGREVIPVIYESIGNGFSEGLAGVKSGGKYGYIDKSGKTVIPFNFTVAFEFSQGLAGVEIDGKYGYIDKTGQMVIQPGEFGAGAFSQGFAVINRWSEGSEFIDRTGRSAFDGKFATADGFSPEGLAAVSVRDSDKRLNYGYIDRTGRVVIPLKYSYAYSFDDGLATVVSDGKFGKIDTAGRVVIPIKYDIIQSFSEGLAAVEVDGKYGYIDRTDKLVIPLNFTIGRSFSDGLAQVRVGGNFNGGGKWGYIDRTGRFVIPAKYDKIWSETFKNNGIIGVILNGKKGFADIYGNEFFDF